VKMGSGVRRVWARHDSSTQNSLATVDKFSFGRGVFLRRIVRTITSGSFGAGCRAEYEVASAPRSTWSDFNRNPMEGLRLLKDRRPKRPKPTITPEQFGNLVQLVSELRRR